MIARMRKRPRRPSAPKRPSAKHSSAKHQSAKRSSAKRSAAPAKRSQAAAAGPARLTLTADELAAVYEEMEKLRAELQRVAAQSSARDYELRTALAELEILRMRTPSRCPHCGKSPEEK